MAPRAPTAAALDDDDFEAAPGTAAAPRARAQADTTRPLSDTQKAEFQRLFDLKFPDAQQHHLFSREKYDRVVYCLTNWNGWTHAEKKQHSGGNGHRWMKEFKLHEIGAGSAPILVYKSHLGDSTANDGDSGDELDTALEHGASVKVVSHRDRVFEDLLDMHMAGGHAKNVTLYKRCVIKFGKSIPREMCIEFGKLCPGCNQVAPRTKVAAGHQPIVTKGFGTRGQLDLIDFQSSPDGPFKFLAVYQDHGIKIPDCGPLESRRASAVALFLFKTFTFIGAPSILQTDNGTEVRTPLMLPLQRTRPTLHAFALLHRCAGMLEK